MSGNTAEIAFKRGKEEYSRKMETTWDYFRSELLPDLLHMDGGMLLYRGGKPLAVSYYLLEDFGFEDDDLDKIDSVLWSRKEEQARFLSQMALVLRGEKEENAPYILTRADGREVKIRLQFGRVSIEGEEPVCCCIILREQKELPINRIIEDDNEGIFRIALDHSLSGIGIMDDSLNLIYINQAMLDIYGYDSFEDIKDVPMIKTIAPECLKMVAERARNWQEGRPNNPKFQYRIVRKNGEIRDVEVMTHMMYLRGMKCRMHSAIDLTDRLNTEKALKFSEARLKTLEGAMLDLMMEIDTDFNFVRLNDAASKFFGPSAIHRKAFNYFEGDKQRSSAMSAFQDIFTCKSDSATFQSTHLSRDGSSRTLAWLCKPCKSEDGKVNAILSIAREVV